MSTPVSPVAPESLFDRVLAAFWLLAGLGICATHGCSASSAPSGPDAGFFLLLAGALMAAAGAGLLLTSRRRTVEGAPLAARRIAAAGAAGARRYRAAGRRDPLARLPRRRAGRHAGAPAGDRAPLARVRARPSAGARRSPHGALFGPILGTVLPRGPWGF